MMRCSKCRKPTLLATYVLVNKEYFCQSCASLKIKQLLEDCESYWKTLYIQLACNVACCPEEELGEWTHEELKREASENARAAMKYCKIATENEQLRLALRNLICRINGDGGQLLTGDDVADAEAAEQRFVDTIVKIERLREELARRENSIAAAAIAGDALSSQLFELSENERQTRSENERLRKQLSKIASIIKLSDQKLK